MTDKLYNAVAFVEALDPADRDLLADALERRMRLPVIEA